MDAYRRWSRGLRNVLILVMSATAIFGWVMPASAFLLVDPGNCHPGQKWDVSHPVKVRVLDDSVSDYFRLSGTSATDGRTRMDRDIDAVISLYNAVPGSRLVLERGNPINGDSDLRDTGKENYGDQTIVIGFTNGVFDSDKTAEAATNRKAEACTLTRAHVRFRKNDDNNTQPFIWVFGPPDDYKCNGDCRSFSTKDQPHPPGNTSERTFLAILTHEMGHAMGLEHPDDDYALMAQNSRTWFRGKNEVLHTQPLPDDIAALLTLYGGTNDRMPLDVSVTNTWYQSDAAQFTTACDVQYAAVRKASDALAEATDVPRARQVSTGSSSSGPQDPSQDEKAHLLQALTDASNALQVCKDGLNAQQLKHCLVSSRADDWTPLVARSKGKIVTGYCGVQALHSVYPAVSNRICPGQQVQIRYTLNNHTRLRDVLVRTEAWFSADMVLNTTDGSDVQSPDLREVSLPAASSLPDGRVFRLPAKVPADAKGQTYVFVRAVPYDPRSNASLLETEADQWNNAVMTPDAIKIDPAACS